MRFDLLSFLTLFMNWITIFFLLLLTCPQWVKQWLYILALFLHCDFFCQIWFVVYDWLDFVLVKSFNISNHLTQFGSFGCQKDIIRLIWFSSAWILWNERNARIFMNSHKIPFTACLTT